MRNSVRIAVLSAAMICSAPSISEACCFDWLFGGQSTFYTPYSAGYTPVYTGYAPYSSWYGGNGCNTCASGYTTNYAPVYSPMVSSCGCSPCSCTGGCTTGSCPGGNCNLLTPRTGTPQPVPEPARETFRNEGDRTDAYDRGLDAGPARDTRPDDGFQERGREDFDRARDRNDLDEMMRRDIDPDAPGRSIIEEEDTPGENTTRRIRSEAVVMDSVPTWQPRARRVRISLTSRFGSVRMARKVPTTGAEKAVPVQLAGN